MTQELIKYASMIFLMMVGIFMVYEGVSYIKMRQTNASIPESIYAAATLSIFVGVCEFIFGLAHYWF